MNFFRTPCSTDLEMMRMSGVSSLAEMMTNRLVWFVGSN